jgi:hypothetical protein
MDGAECCVAAKENPATKLLLSGGVPAPVYVQGADGRGHRGNWAVLCSTRARPAGAADQGEQVTGRTSTELAYTTRRRRLSSITRAPCRKVMGMPGQRSQEAPRRATRREPHRA